jgi:hypothetical protein
MILMPPRHGKSQLVSRHFPAWYIGRNPTKQIISASYASDLASGFGRDVRNLVASQEFAAIFPGVRLADDSAAKNLWHTTQGGIYVAAGVGTGITGKGADILNIDDPVKDRAEAESQTIRDGILAWYTSTSYTRLMPGAAVILTMTRWHEDDLGGTLLQMAGGDKWDVLSLPALASANDDPLGRAANEALWPAWYDETALAKIRANIGERDFGALYQQDPRPAGTSFFDVQCCLVDGQPVDAPKNCESVFAVMDTAIKTGTKNDGTGILYCAFSPHFGYQLTILDWEIQQIEGAMLETWFPVIYETLEGYAKAQRARMGALGVYIEDKASGSILLQQAARRGWPAKAIESGLTAVGKDERAISVSGYVTRGDVKISRHAYEKITNYKGRNGNHFLMQVFRFQVGVKDQADDLLDCFTYSAALALGNSDGY